MRGRERKSSEPGTRTDLVVGDGVLEKDIGVAVIRLGCETTNREGRESENGDEVVSEVANELELFPLPGRVGRDGGNGCGVAVGWRWGGNGWGVAVGILSRVVVEQSNGPGKS